MRVSVSGVRWKSGRVKQRDRLWSRIGGLPIHWRHMHCMHWVCRHQRVHRGHRRVWRRERGQAHRAGGRGQTHREWWGGAFCCLQRGTFLCRACPSVGSSWDSIGLSMLPWVFTCSIWIVHGSFMLRHADVFRRKRAVHFPMVLIFTAFDTHVGSRRRPR